VLGERQFVFGYGSLAAAPGVRLQRGFDPLGFIADLVGFVRSWGVAMDNRRDLPGYKYYTGPDGDRPAVYVAFLDLHDEGEERYTGKVRDVDEGPEGRRASVTNGVCLPVDADRLAKLDLRERNYARRDVSDRVEAGGARVWTYVGSPDGRERLAEGLRAGSAVVDAGYLRAVRAAFAALGRAESRAARQSIEPGELPVRELTRHELAV
jgi:hypothetical protein